MVYESIQVEKYFNTDGTDWQFWFIPDILLWLIVHAYLISVILFTQEEFVLSQI